MHKRRFRYREIGEPPVPRPTLDVTLWYPPNGEWTTQALIDTGAPGTLFDRGAADALGVKFGYSNAVTQTVAILGERRVVQFEDVEIGLLGDPSFQWTARVGFFCDKFQIAFQGILGTDGFLDKWAVTFNKYYDYFELGRADHEEV